MADSGSGVKQFTGEMTQAASEVAKDVKDEIGQMIEQGVQSIAGKQLTPQQINNPTASEQQKELDRQKKLAETRRKLKWYQDIAAAQKKLTEEEKQKQLQKQQQEEQEKQRKKLEETQRKQPIPQVGKRQCPLLREDIARTRQEIGKGHGVGG